MGVVSASRWTAPSLAVLNDKGVGVGDGRVEHLAGMDDTLTN